jgi:hypothetical protein
LVFSQATLLTTGGAQGSAAVAGPLAESTTIAMATATTIAGATTLKRANDSIRRNELSRSVSWRWPSWQHNVANRRRTFVQRVLNSAGDLNSH